MGDKLDCIVIGFYEHHYEEEFQKKKEAQGDSGFYYYVLGQLVPFRGRRIPYMELLNTVLTETTGRDHQLNLAETPNLGVVVLASFLCNRNFNVGMINFFNREKQRLIDMLAQSPKAVAITTTYYEDSGPIRNIIDFVKQYNTDTKIIVGGPYVFNLCHNNDAETQNEIFREIGADIYIHDSQGELTLSMALAELCKERGQDLSRIPNLIYTLDNKEFHRNERVIENNEMDENSVDWRFFDKEFYTPFASMRTARSCAYSCAFCSYPYFAGPLNLTSLPVVENELAVLKDSGVKYISFIDDTFNVPLPRFKNLLKSMIANKYDFKWYSYFRCSNADDETFDLMRDSGCIGVFLGIESGDQNILVNMNKRATVAKYKDSIRKLKERGIPAFVSMIVGFPGETRETVQNTIDFLNETDPTFYAAELYWHSKSVPIHREADKYGIEGEGYSWKHNTMDWQEAAELTLEVYRSVKGPVIMPTYTFSIDAAPYLMSKGFSIEKIVRFAGVATDMLVKGFDSDTPDTGDEERRLREIFM